MKKFLFVLVVLALAGMTTFAAEPTEKEIGSLWLQITELNRDQFPDSNKVEVGDTVKIPGDSCVVVQSWNLSGGKNCLWNIGRSILIGDTGLTKIPAITTSTLITSNQDKVSPDEVSPIIMAILFGAIIVGYIIWRLRERELSLNNPLHPPVVRGGLTGTPQQVLNTIQHHAGKIVQKVEGGKLQSRKYPDGNVSFIAKVRYAGSGNPATEKRIQNETMAWRATIAESNEPNVATHCEIWLARCGNEICAELPDAWQFIPEEGKVAEREPEKPAVTTDEKTPATNDISVTVTDIDGNQQTFSAKGTADSMPARAEIQEYNDGGKKITIVFRRQASGKDQETI